MNGDQLIVLFPINIFVWVQFTRIRQTEIRNHKPIRAIWSFKHKRAPNGRIIKHKARLCAHGGMQVHGEHFWETYGSDDDSMPHDDTITVTWFA
jgi:hypothetical protein